MRNSLSCVVLGFKYSVRLTLSSSQKESNEWKSLKRPSFFLAYKN